MLLLLLLLYLHVHKQHFLCFFWFILHDPWFGGKHFNLLEAQTQTHTQVHTHNWLSPIWSIMFFVKWTKKNKRLFYVIHINKKKKIQEEYSVNTNYYYYDYIIYASLHFACNVQVRFEFSLPLLSFSPIRPQNGVSNPIITFIKRCLIHSFESIHTFIHLFISFKYITLTLKLTKQTDKQQSSNHNNTNYISYEYEYNNNNKYAYNVDELYEQSSSSP